MVGLKITNVLKALSLKPNAKFTDFTYGMSGRIYQGKISIVSAIGSRRPPEGQVWIQDYNGVYWEVSDADFKTVVESDD